MRQAFITAVSHELPTPLTSLRLAAESLQLGRVADVVPMLLARLVVNAQRLDRLLQDLLDLNQFAHGQIALSREDARLDQLVHDAVAQVELGAHEITLDLDEVSCAVAPTKYERIVLNLVANAVVRTPPGRITIHLHDTRDGALLVVEDEGPGIPGGDQEAVFKAFHQGDTAPPHRPGTGSASRWCPPPPSSTAAVPGSSPLRPAAPPSTWSCPTPARRSGSRRVRSTTPPRRVVRATCHHRTRPVPPMPRPQHRDATRRRDGWPQRRPTVRLTRLADLRAHGGSLEPAEALQMPHPSIATSRLWAVLLAAACVLTTTVAIGAPPAEAAPAAVASSATATRSATPLRLAGGTRHATSVAVARAAWPSGTTRAVVARADQYADALAGGPMAAAMDAPVLLTDSGSLHADVAAALEDLGVDHVTVLGGEAAITPQVVDQLRAGGRTVTRLSGPDRWATAAAIAAETVRLRRDPLFPPRVLVVEGANADPSRGWPDAVAAGAWAASTGSPILLTTAGGLPGPTVDALDALADDLGGVTIVGGPTAVSAEVEVALLRTGLDVERVAGGDRWATSAAVADRHTANADVSSVLLTSGRNWPDALVAGPAAAAAGSTLLLTDTRSVPPPIATWLGDHAVDVVAAVGGAAVVADPTLQAAADRVALPGARRWHDAATWASGAVPADGQAVDVPAGAAVVVDGPTAAVGRVSVQGRLDLAAGGQLDAESVAVHGRMAAGSPLARLDGEAALTLRGRAGAADRPMTGTGGLEVHGGHLTMAGQPVRPFATISETVPAGATQVSLSRPATGWRPGDTVLLTATGKDPAQAERRSVRAVDGRTVTLDQPVAFDHVAVSDTVGGIRVHQAGELANLSRTITLAGAGTGGHVMAMRAGGDAGHAPTLQVSNVQSVGMGQSGLLARYAFHTHMLGRVDSVRLDTVSVVDSNNRCVTIHGTSGAVVTRLVAHGAAGHCVFFEDGAETANVVAGSLVAGQSATSGGARLVETDGAPAAFWLQHPSNAVFDNVAAGGDGHGFWWDLPARPTGLSATDRVRPRTAPLGYADGNVAHSQAKSGDHRSGTGLRVDDYDPPGTAAFTRHRAWQNQEFGAWLESSDRVVADRFVAVGNATGVQLHGGAVRRATLVGASSNPFETSYFMAGIGLYHGGGDARDVTFANFTTDKNWKHAAAVTGRAHSHHQLARIAGASLVDVPMPLRIFAPWQDDEVAHTGVVDVDGTLTGSAGTYVSQPSMREGSCQGVEVAGAAAFRCATTDPTNVGVLVRDDSGSQADFGVSDLVSGGTRTRAVTDLSFFSRPQIEAVVGTGGTYRVDPGRALGDNVEVILIGTRAADATLVLPWTAGQVHVYSGWGEWAQPVSATVDDGAVRLKVAAAAAPAGFYERWKVCAVKGCGDGTGSRRE